ncbi:MAG: DUF2306 domain-containing protein [Chitinophagaceae bacterium]|nr:DUF2306 domain-containing protein [Chitinophagaceae bacterium]
MPNRLFQILYFPFALLVLLFSAVMLAMIVNYFPPGKEVMFLTTKPSNLLQRYGYQISFYTHIVGSVVPLALGIFQFASFLYHHNSKLHRGLGYVYISSVLLFAAPSGFVISMYANGGLVAQLGFYCLSIFWWLTTLSALVHALRKRFDRHLLWMIRSYAITLAALSLRTEGYFLHFLPKSNPIDIYTALSWLSWVGNLFVVEILLYFGLEKHLSHLFFKTTKNGFV